MLNEKGQEILHDEQTIISRLESLHPRFEYVGGYTGIDGYLYIMCKDCGMIKKKTSQILRPSRNYKLNCSSCSKLIDKFEKDRNSIERKKKKYEIKFWNQNFVQQSYSCCKHCKSLFIPNGNRKAYCSIKCANYSIWKYKDAYRNEFPLDKVFDNDNGICYLCGGICDWNDYEIVDGVIIYGNNYPSRDHVIPKSKGGKNSWDNIRLAHRVCNSIKGNRVS